MSSKCYCAAMALLMLTGSPAAVADLVWRAPATVPSHQHHGGHDAHASDPSQSGNAQKQGGHGTHRKPEVLQLNDPADAQLSLWRSDLKRSGLSADNGELVLKPTGVDSYHAVVAERLSGDTHESAVRYVTLRGKPSGHSPAELLAIEKLPLEIVPDPIAREHHRYLSDRPAKFRIRFEGRPLPGASVSLETSNGSHLEATADRQGRLEFRLPEDFTDIEVGRRNNPPADFIVRTRHEENGRQYRASLSAPYHVNPHHWQSNGAGLAAAASGFVVGVGILGVAGRRKKSKKAGEQ